MGVSYSTLLIPEPFRRRVMQLPLSKLCSPSALPRCRVMTYNILAPSLSDPNYFSYAAEHCLSWKNYRKHLFMKEIRVIDPDIMCLQEVCSPRRRGRPFKDVYLSISLPWSFRFILDHFKEYKGVLLRGEKLHGVAVMYKAEQWASPVSCIFTAVTSSTPLFEFESFHATVFLSASRLKIVLA